MGGYSVVVSIITTKSLFWLSPPRALPFGRKGTDSMMMLYSAVAWLEGPCQLPTATLHPVRPLAHLCADPEGGGNKYFIWPRKIRNDSQSQI